MKVGVGSIDSRMVNPCRTYITTRKTNDSSRFPWLKAMIFVLGVRQGRGSVTLFSRTTHQESTESMVWSVVGVVPGSIHVCLCEKFSVRRASVEHVHGREIPNFHRTQIQQQSNHFFHFSPRYGRRTSISFSFYFSFSFSFLIENKRLHECIDST
jgi:hypothetical protein